MVECHPVKLLVVGIAREGRYQCPTSPHLQGLGSGSIVSFCEVAASRIPIYGQVPPLRAGVEIQGRSAKPPLYHSGRIEFHQLSGTPCTEGVYIALKIIIDLVC